MAITFISFDASGTDGTDRAAMQVLYEYDGQQVAIPGDVPGEDPTVITAAVRTAVLAELGISEAEATVQDGAHGQAAAIPNWSSWSESEALTWHDTNITDALPVANLSEANAVLEKIAAENRAIVRFIVALRNEQWPGLEAGG
jgi:hypothetical protein